MSLKYKLSLLPKSSEGHWTISHRNIIEYLKKLHIKNMLEIGFNTGFSATMFLELLHLDKFYSIDIGIHNHIDPLYKRFKNIYGNKFHSIIEDSLNIRNTFLNNIKYDLIFIDGSHSFKNALNDFLFCIENKKTKYILLDDTHTNYKGVNHLVKYININYNNNVTIIKKWDIGTGCILYKII